MINGTDILNNNLNNDTKWGGLIELNSSNINYQNSLKKLKDELKENDNLGIKYLNTEVYTIYSGYFKNISNFKNYLKSEKFEEIDPNGNIIPEFNITYICTDCKIPTTYENFNYETSLLNEWYSLIDNYRKVINDSFIFNDFIQTEEEIDLNTKINMYKTFKFYNIVKDLYESYYIDNKTYFDFPWILLFIINIILFILGGFVYFVIKKKISIINVLNENNFHNPETKKQNRVKFRWVFHIIVNFNIFSAIIMSMYSFVLILMSIVIYEGSTVIETYFIRDNKMDSFIDVPNGDLINGCMKSSPDERIPLDALQISALYEIILNILTTGKTFEQDSILYSDNVYNKYSELESKINEFSLSKFHSKDNITFKWDDVDDESINYFLFRLPEYKYFTAPKETLIEYINWKLDGQNYNNFQKTWCSDQTSSDVWISRSDLCEKIFPDATIIGNYATNFLDNKLKCIPITSPIITQCSDLTELKCFISNYIKRYTNEDDFSSCSIPEDKLSESSMDSSKEYFIAKISSYLELAKNEDMLKNRLQNKINTLKENVKSLLGYNRMSVVYELNAATQYFNTLNDQLLATSTKAISADNSEKITEAGLFDRANCSFIYTSNLDNLHLLKSGVSAYLFGSSIIFSILSLLLFFGASVLIVMNFRLRTDNELSEILSYLKTIQALEEKELKFFFVPVDYIETEDKEEIKKTSDATTKRLPSFYKKIIEKTTIMTVKTKQEELSKNAEDELNKVENFKAKKWNAIKRFNFNQSKERDERLKSKNQKKSDKD